MDKFLTFTIVGLSLAAIYAVIASGLVLTYTTTGIFNFAHGAAGMLAAFMYWQLRFAWGWPVPIALVMILGMMAPLFGMVLEVVVMRGFRGTTDTVKLVVSISLLLFMIGLAQIIWPPGVSRPMARFFESGKPITLGPDHDHLAPGHHDHGRDRAGDRAAHRAHPVPFRHRHARRRSTTPRSRRSTAPGPNRVSMLAWAFGTSLGRARRHPDRPERRPSTRRSLSLLIVSAYAAAIFGRLRSLPLTFVGAIVIGLTDGYLTGYLPTNQYLPVSASRARPCCCSSCSWCIPNPRLQAAARVGAASTSRCRACAGALIFAGVIVVAGIV